MSAASVIGYGLIGIGPHLVLFFMLILRKHFLLLLTLASAFIWYVERSIRARALPRIPLYALTTLLDSYPMVRRLTTLLFQSAIMKYWTPLDPSASPWAGALAFSILLQVGGQSY